MRAKLLSAVGYYANLPRPLYALFVARIVNSMGAFVYPFLALFLKERLGFSEAEAGRLILFVAVAHVPGSLLGGRLADRVGRKRVIVLGQALAGAFLLPGAFLGTSIMVAWSVVAAQFFAALAQPAMQATVVDLSGPENRQAAFSLLYLGYNLGFAVGPMLAGFLYRYHPAWLFLGDALTTFLSVALVAALVPETRPSAQQIASSRATQSGERAEEGSTLRVLLGRPLLLFFATILALLAFVYSQHTFSLPLHLRERFGEPGPVLYGSLMTFNALQVILLTAPLVAMTRRRNPASNILLACGCYAVGFGVLRWIAAPPLLYLSTSVWTLGEILVTTNASVYIASHTPVSHRGRFNAIVPLMIGAGQAISPPLVGELITRYSVSLVWPVLSGLAAVAAVGLVVLLVLERRVRPRREE